MTGRSDSTDHEADRADDTRSNQEDSSGETAAPAGPRAVTLPARYEDLGLIGSGAFGDVHRVLETLLDRVLAMKVLRARHVESIAIRRRFSTEAQIAAQLQHPGIVTAYDRGELRDGRLWFTMREVRGRTLRDVIADMHAASSPAGVGAAPGGWTLRRLVDAFARVAQAVAYVHSRGVVHRDLKPANLMVGEFGEVVMMDWGVARRIGHAAARDEGGSDAWSDTRSPKATQVGDVVGTPAYMPPEQASGDSELHGPGSDIYSLGAVLYSLLSSRPPYEGRGPDVVLRILAGPPLPLAEAALGGPPVPAELARICARAMRRDITDRHPSAEALAAEVLLWLDGALRCDQALVVDEEAARFAARLEAHDRRGQHAAFLRGEGRLSLTTDPPGAEVTLVRQTAHDRRLVAEPPVHLGQALFHCIHPLGPRRRRALRQREGLPEPGHARAARARRGGRRRHAVPRRDRRAAPGPPGQPPPGAGQRW